MFPENIYSFHKLYSLKVLAQFACKILMLVESQKSKHFLTEILRVFHLLHTDSIFIKF